MRPGPGGNAGLNMEIAQEKIDQGQRKAAALMGMYIGAALAMPVHWYYNRKALGSDYGRVPGYRAPRNPHPGSILWRSSYHAPNPGGDILHDQARYWGRAGVHYHQFLRAGENTLNLKLCTLLIDTPTVKSPMNQ